MKKLTFITGGCRSGKSTLAISLAKSQKGRIAYIATAVGFDAEMRARIKKHKTERPGHWITIEEPKELSTRIFSIAELYDTVIIDCLTVYLGNRMVKKLSAENIQEETRNILKAINAAHCQFIVVSNEVGLGIVPATALGRKFRDVAGEMNKAFAAAADRVYCMVSGIPLKIK
jgi:adenosylcobinamide kinase / adenosylcobinamide-phosphate guanylyltransferase